MNWEDVLMGFDPLTRTHRENIAKHITYLREARDGWKDQAKLEGEISETRIRMCQEKCARILSIIEDWTRADTIRLRAGEMTAQEMRTVQAVMRGLLEAVREAQG